MDPQELTDFRNEMRFTQAEFGAWLGERANRSAYPANIISRYESGRASVPWAIAAVIWKHQRDQLRASQKSAESG